MIVGKKGIAIKELFSADTVTGNKSKLFIVSGNTIYASKLVKE